LFWGVQNEFLKELPRKFTLKVVGDVCVLKLDGKFMAGGDSFFLREKIKNRSEYGHRKAAD
jgi:hypothetical protein